MAPRSDPYRPDAPIVAELAAGAILLAAGTREVLLLHHRAEDRWCFPKGHVDPGESLSTAALREIAEEAGLTHVELGEELLEVQYRFYRPDRGVNVHKSTVYFSGRTMDRGLRLESTFDRAQWVRIEEAREILPFDTDRAVVDAERARLDARPVPRTHP